MGQAFLQRQNILKKKKLLLLQPPIQDFYQTPIRLQPVGLGYLKAAIHKYMPDEMEVVVKDYHQGGGRKTIPLPKELSYLKDFYAWPDQSPFSSFYHYYHYGVPFDLLAEDVVKEKPDIVGISSLFSPYYREVLRSAEEIKKRLKIPIIVGGSHVSAMPLFMLQQPGIDFIIQAEGERPMVEFLREWKNGGNYAKVPNLGYEENGRHILNKVEDNFPIEELPFPDLSDLARDRYHLKNRPLHFLVSSRGCPHQCSFCSVHLTFGTGYRKRSTSNVLQEIKKRYEEGVRVFDFEDDDFTCNGEEIKELCKKLMEAFPKDDIELTAMNGISYFSLDSELLTLMKKAGFRHLNLSLVSVDGDLQQRTKRPHSIDKYLEVVREACELRFQVVSYQILGLPHEQIDSMIQTLALNSTLPVLLGASIFYLTPNSPIARDFPEPSEGEVFRARLTAISVETEHFNREDLYTLFVTARIINFLKGLKFEEDELPFREVLDRTLRGKGRMVVGAELLENFFAEQTLYASTKSGFKVLPRFKAELFFRVWTQLDFIKTQENKNIVLDKSW